MSTSLCPRCQTPNRSSAKFCSKCGFVLTDNISISDDKITALPGLKPGETLHDRYRIEHELGRGGFGAVYRVWDINLNRPCAVKENLETSEEARRQFIREATVLANLSHRNLPRVTDYFSIENQGQYLVMDFVEGEDLANLLQRAGMVPVKQTLEWAIQVADALEYLHNRVPPVFHRDIKPSNIRITPDDRVMLVDFGLVKVFDQQLRTTIGARAVTPGYAPPEQYGQGATDARSDIYALGATIFTMLTEQQPLESVQRMSGGQLLPAHQVNPTVPVSLGNLVEKAMALAPAGRFQSVTELKAELENNLAGKSPAYDMVSPVVKMERVPATQVMSPEVRARVPARSKPKTSGAGRTIFGLAIVFVIILCIGSFLGLGAWAIASQNNTNQARIAVAIELTDTASHKLQLTQTEIHRSTAEIENQLHTTQDFIATASARVRLTSTALAIQTLDSRSLIEKTASAPASWYVGSLDADVTSLLFFLEKDGEKNYGTTFVRDEVDRVYFELNLKHNTTGFTEFSLTVIYYIPDGEFITFTSDHKREQDWTTSWHTNSCCNSYEGNFLVGTYQVDIFVDGEKVATGTFEIVD